MNCTLMEIERSRFCRGDDRMLTAWQRVFRNETFSTPVRSTRRKERGEAESNLYPRCRLYVSFSDVYVVQHIESKNRPAFGYAMNCLERTRFLVEKRKFLFPRESGRLSSIYSDCQKGASWKGSRKFLSRELRSQTGCLSSCVLSISLTTHLFIYKDPRISLMEVIFYLHITFHENLHKWVPLCKIPV